MNLAPIWGSLVIFIVCPLLGGLPLIDWITYGVTGRQLKKLGTGNVSVSAAFYHGGKLAGVLAVLSEAGKGILAVLLARAFFPTGSVWEIMAIIAVVIGRYWISQGAGATNAVWGIVAHDAIAAGIIFLTSLIGFTIFCDRKTGKFSALVLLATIIGLRHPQQPEYGITAIALASLLGWIYQQIPDDLDLPATQGRSDTQGMFRFFQGDKTIITLNNKLDANQVGSKAANLSLVKRLGYSVPEGWVLAPGENFKSLVAYLQPSTTAPLVVRSSAIGEDSETASAAGQYLSILDVTNTAALQTAILDCQASYLQNTAREYRRDRAARSSKADRAVAEKSMAILVQRQIEGRFSGVAFSRDPVDPFSQGVAIEALPGKATQVVSGRVNPQRYSVFIPELSPKDSYTDSQITVVRENPTDSNDSLPRDIIESVAFLAREMEDLFDGVPQDIEWTYDGEKLWLLQVRPITTLQPIWTRRIAAEVIPGKIRPLTWSINQPLTCGVWGQLFTVVLGKKAQDLDFSQTATLHFASAYFNATLLGQIFRRMGLPAESLEFLTRGAKFTKPPLTSTLKNFPGLWRLIRREWHLEQNFNQDDLKFFSPSLSLIEQEPVEDLSEAEIIPRIETILELLDKATYYNILAPLSLAIRQAILKVPETALDNTQTPEVEAVKALADMASDTKKLLATEQITMDSCASLFAHIAENSEGESILTRFNCWLNNYGYMSEVATDIAIPRWRDNPAIAREMFTRFFFDRQFRKQTQRSSDKLSSSWQTQIVQNRLNLKGRVSEVYNKLLAHLRWSFLALAQHWLQLKMIDTLEDIFFLSFSEIKAVVAESDIEIKQHLSKLIAQRKQQWQQNKKLTAIPQLVYGNPHPNTLLTPAQLNSQQLVGIGTSPGRIEGSVKIVSSLQQTSNIDHTSILVVPYTDAGWSPLLARAGGLISEVGGRLSHGAIVAREYNIPAVMDVPNATHLLKEGQRVIIDGQTGIVEILD